MCERGLVGAVRIIVAEAGKSAKDLIFDAGRGGWTALNHACSPIQFNGNDVEIVSFFSETLGREAMTELVFKKDEKGCNALFNTVFRLTHDRVMRALLTAVGTRARELIEECQSQDPDWYKSAANQKQMVTILIEHGIVPTQDMIDYFENNRYECYQDLEFAKKLRELLV